MPSSLIRYDIRYRHLVFAIFTPPLTIISFFIIISLPITPSRLLCFSRFIIVFLPSLMPPLMIIDIDMPSLVFFHFLPCFQPYRSDAASRLLHRH